MSQTQLELRRSTIGGSGSIGEHACRRARADALKKIAGQRLRETVAFIHDVRLFLKSRSRIAGEGSISSEGPIGKTHRRLKVLGRGRDSSRPLGISEKS